MVKRLINYCNNFLYLYMFEMRWWAILFLLWGLLGVPCYASMSETVASVRQMETLSSVNEQGDIYMCALTDFGNKIEPEQVEDIYRAYESEQHVKNIILYSGIFIVLMAGVVIVILVYTLKVRARTQRSMQEMEEVRQNFFTNITHEFRTPLTVILGITDGLKKRLADRHTEAGFDLIIRQGNEMLSLVNQLLYISKVRSVVSHRDWRTGDIVPLLRMMLESTRVQTAKELIDIEFTTSNDSIQMDFVPDYMQKLLQGLLSNSVKFTPRGGKIKVSVALEKKVVNISIFNSGTDIPEKDLSHIFDPFYQGDTSTDNLRTSIELLLVRQMAEAMDGKIEVLSGKGQGTKFVITLPQQHAEEEFERWSAEEELTDKELPVNEDFTLSEKEEPVNDDETELSMTENTFPVDEELRQPTLLVIEDNTDIARYIAAVLDNRYRLLFARDGKEGLAKAEEYMPDLILTDLMMPEMDGYELCRTIRASEILNHIPVIVVTARCEEKDRLMGLEAGADAYLIKPFSVDELKIRIAKLLEQRRLLREKYSRALQEGQSESVDISDADKDFIARLQKVLFANISDTDLSSELLADKLFMSKSQLNRKVKSITGLDTATYVRQSRMSFAKKLLSSGDLSIGDIVMQCGFESPSYFTKTFKQYFGVTPTQFRKQQMNK